MKLKFGVNVSIAGGIDKAVDRALELNCETFQMFTRSNRQWATKELDDESVTLFKEKAKKSNYNECIVHMPYLPNFASIEKILWEKSVATLLSETKRCDALEIPYLVLHLGSHKGVGLKKGINQLIKALDLAIEQNPKVTLLLENMAGTKNSVGSRFEDIGSVIEGLTDSTNVGVCFDTCHAFAAGYDLRTKAKVESTLELFNNTIGIDRIKYIHANDSTGPLNCGRDRHEHIGLGHIKDRGFIAITRLFPKVPYVLETPVDDRRDDMGNLEYIRELAEKKIKKKKKK